jgi:hypothetical protein
MSYDPRSRPDPIALVWIGGIVLAVLAFVMGPTHLVSEALDALQRAAWYVDDLVRSLGDITINLERAVAIGLYGTFLGLSLLALHRGAPALGGLIVVSIVFLLLVWGAEGPGAGANLRWAAALVLAALAALSITRRLAARPPPPPPMRRP